MKTINEQEVKEHKLRMRTHTRRLVYLVTMFNELTDTQRELVFCGLVGMADCTTEDKNYKALVEEMKIIRGLSL